MKIIHSHVKDLGDNFHVRRSLPSIETRHAGPFVFLDHFGPVEMLTGEELVVRPHPHIGLATLTYLYEGAILHRDSLGTEQMILPEETNWMTSGNGIAHSERSRKEYDQVRIEGIQAWVALPVEAEDCDPEFFHYDKSQIPELSTDSFLLRLIAGEFLGLKSPVKIYSPLFYADFKAKKASSISWDSLADQELGLYISKGTISLRDSDANQSHELKVGDLAYFAPGEKVEFEHSNEARIVVLGGKAHPEKRFLYWNFVSSSQEKINKAKIRWEEDSFAKVPNEDDRIPLPKP
ncbi:MAG: pirin family protein [Leptospira sp.]|nr:pirin family protein [Leptospira sp.]